MIGHVSFDWICQQLANRIGISRQLAGEIICNAMISGELSALAPRANYSAANPEQFDRSAKYFWNRDFEVPPNLWHSFSTDWESSKLYIQFHDKHGVYLTPDIFVQKESAYRFVRAKDPMFQQPQAAAAISNAVGTKNAGGAPPKIDWESCLIEAARWMYANEVPITQSKLINYIAEYLGSNSPSETQLKAHLAPLYRAFRGVDEG